MNRNSIISSLLIAFMMQSMCVSAQGTITRKKKENSTTSPTKPKPASKPNKNTSQSINISAQEKERIINNLISNMVYVEGGTFMMGATSEQGSDTYSEEKPAHQVTLSSFSIGKYEVTQEEWQVVMGCNPSSYKGAKRPVEEVSWRDSQEFIRKLNTMTGKRFRLPTEAEWEYAARGGSCTKGYKYAGSNSIDDVAWYYVKGYDKGGKRHYYGSHDVGQKSPNELGLYDMSGNVWEWCQDWLGSYNGNSQTNPTGPSSGSYHVYRGGSWGDDARYCRVSRRRNIKAYSGAYLGMRLAL